uniref:Acid-sensing ion channel 1 n=1 Tax=Parastrongyloides trichosuri TaxID=131310 RepID=A0A0N4Z1G8_PARTI
MALTKLKTKIDNITPTYFQKLLQLFKDFADWTTISFLNHIFGTSNIILVLIWVACFIGCSYMSVIQSLELLNVYWQYPVNTESRLINQPISFPTVTLCNELPYKNYDQSSRLKQIVNSMTEEGNAAWDLYELQGIDTFPYLEASKFWLTIYSKELLSDTEINYDYNDMIVRCNFGESKCNVTEDTEIVDSPVYGKCVKFNPKGIWTVNQKGSKYGLNLLMLTRNKNKLPFYISTGGVVLIHRDDEYPFVETNPILLSPGFSTSIGLSISSSKRLSFPFGDCIPNDDTEKIKNNINYYGGNYDTQKCLKSCVQKRITVNCGCFYAGIAFVDENNENIPDCADLIERNQTLRLSLYQCIRNQQFPDFTKDNPFEVFDNSDCQCRETCEKTYFDTSYSIGGYADKSFIPRECSTKKINEAITNNVSLPYEYNRDACLAYFRENGIHLEIYFEKLGFVEEFEYPAYEVCLSIPVQFFNNLLDTTINI